MRKNSRILKLMFLFLVLVTVPCAASERTIKINDLVERATSLNNKEVVVQGEVIGEALERGEYAWININDKTNAIGIWVKKSDIDQIQCYGDYKHQGDTVKVVGTFHRACSEHGGDVDIHCTEIDIVEAGYVIKEQISVHKIIVATALILISLIMISIYLKIKKSLKFVC